MPHDYPLTKIVLLRLARGGVSGALPFFGNLLDHVLIGSWEDIKDEKRRTEIHLAIEQIQRQVSEIQQRTKIDSMSESRGAIIEVLNNSLRQLNPPEGHAETTILRVKLERLERVLRNFIDCLEDPSHTSPSPELEAAIEEHAVSKGTLARVENQGKKRVVIEIADLEIGKWFFPLQFMRKQIQIAEIQSEPFKSLFEPAEHAGDFKSICINSRIGEFKLTAWPKPVVLNSLKTGKTTQLDEITVDKQLSSAPFEYWPNGYKNPKFIVESKLAQAFQLVFREKGGTDSPIICLRMLWR